MKTIEERAEEYISLFGRANIDLEEVGEAFIAGSASEQELYQKFLDWYLPEYRKSLNGSNSGLYAIFLEDDKEEEGDSYLSPHDHRSIFQWWQLNINKE